jgi:hypothetical protein
MWGGEIDLTHHAHRESGDDTNFVITGRIASHGIYKTGILEDIFMSRLQFSHRSAVFPQRNPKQGEAIDPAHEAVQVWSRQNRITESQCRV